MAKTPAPTPENPVALEPAAPEHTIDVKVDDPVAPSPTTTTRKLDNDGREVVSLGSLSLAGKLSNLTGAGTILGALTPRSTARSTPREPEPHNLSACLVFQIPNPNEPPAKPWQNTTGYALEGATVSELPGILSSSFASYYDWAVQIGDVILSIGGKPFESSKPLTDYVDPYTKRAYMCEVRRMVTPPRFPLTARLGRSLMGSETPETEQEMLEKLLDYEDLQNDIRGYGTKSSFEAAMHHGSMNPYYGGMGMGGMGGMGGMSSLHSYRGY